MRNGIALLIAGFLFTGFVAPAAAAEVPAETAPAASPPDTRPVLAQWRAAMEAALARTNPETAPPAPPVGAGPSLKPGASGARVDRLAAQLIARGLLAAGDYTGSYDAAVEHAVRDFQAAEGMTADGLAGESTVEALDRDQATTAAILKATLAELRTLAAEAPGELFLINIPSQTAALIQGNTVAMSMRVAVGRPSRPTPILKDRITDVILNPTWTAPTTVLAQDKLPSLRKHGNPGINGATIYVDGLEVDPALVDWSAVTPDRLRIVQSPGDDNALGRFKFNLTNGQSIYLHDTNDHSVFSRLGRALSSGCVRLAEPRRLAETLLGREGWTPERISQAVDAEHTRGIGLSHPLAVRIVYWQASVDPTGAVRIHRDIYRRYSQPAVAAAPAPTAAPAIQPAATRPAAVPAPSPQQTQTQTQKPADPQPAMAVTQVVKTEQMQIGDAVIQMPALPVRPTKVASGGGVAKPAAVRCKDDCTTGLY